MWPFANALGFIPLFCLSMQSDLGGSVGPMNHKTSLSLTALFVVAWSNLLRGAECVTKDEVQRHLEMGKKFLAAGQLADALSHYHAAVEGDPDNYMTYFRRATVYLAMGKSKSAIPDLDKVLELKQDFVAARMQRGNVRLKQGKIDEAYIDFEQVVAKEPENMEARQKLDTIEPLKYDITSARELYANHDYHEAIDLLGHAVEVCPWDPYLRELRAECYIAVGDYFKAIGDIRPTTKLRSDNTAGYYKLSQLHYEMGEADESLTEIRECLKLDPDHKECFPHYKKVKKLVKQISSIHSLISEQRWDDCLGKVDQMLKTETKVPAYIHRAEGHRCHCHSKYVTTNDQTEGHLGKTRTCVVVDVREEIVQQLAAHSGLYVRISEAQAGHITQALDSCNEVLSRDEGDIEALCDRADIYLTNEQYEEAIADFKKAQEINNGIHRVQEGLKRAEKLLKQSKKRDYYKILGVKRNASKKEIIKAYRKLAVQWHPDKYEDADKKHAEKQFIDIASAKEVLTDPEKREKFDNGEDPLDPEEQAGGGFHQGFNPFGQGGFQFKFHFG